MRGAIALLAASMMAAPAPPADLKAVRAEVNAEKRADLAIDFAERLATQLSKTYEGGDWNRTQAGLGEIASAVELCLDSLHAAGKSARKSPKHFKRAELKARNVLRRLASFATEVSFDDRAPAEAARARVQKVHDKLMEEIMAVK